MDINRFFIGTLTAFLATGTFFILLVGSFVFADLSKSYFTDETVVSDRWIEERKHIQNMKEKIEELTLKIELMKKTTTSTTTSTTTTPSSVHNFIKTSESYKWASPFSKCTFDIIVLEDRLDCNKDTYVEQGIIIKKLYAEQFGYGYDVVKVLVSHMKVTWAKLPLMHTYLENFLDETESYQGCRYLVLMDADAIVRIHELSFVEILNKLSRKYNMTGDELMIITNEHEMPDNLFGRFPPQKINTGVMFLRYDLLNVELLKTWIKAKNNICSQWINRGSHEQSCLAELIYNQENAFSDEILNRIKVLPMLELNSPWGMYVIHTWGGPSKEFKKWALDAHLLNLNITKPFEKKELCETVEIKELDFRNQF